MNRFKIFATNTGSKTWTSTHWSNPSETSENLKAACGTAADGWSIAEETMTWKVDGQSSTFPTRVTCRKCQRKYGR